MNTKYTAIRLNADSTLKAEGVIYRYEKRGGYCLSSVTLSQSDCDTEIEITFGEDTKAMVDFCESHNIPITTDQRLRVECDHDFAWVDTSFDHEFGTEQQGYWECGICSEVNNEIEPPTDEPFGDEVI